VSAKAFYVVFGPAARVEFLMQDKGAEDLLAAALVTTVGLLVFSIGYLSGNLRWRLPALRRLASDNWDNRRFAAVVGVLVILGLMAFLAFAVRQNVALTNLADLSSKRFQDGGNVANRGGALGYLRWGAMMIEIAFYLVFARWVSRDRLRLVPGLLVAMIGLSAIVFPFFVSSRQTIMFLLMRTLLIWLCIRGQPKPRHAAALLLLALTVLGGMLALRRNQSDWQGVREHLSASSFLEITIGGRHLLDLTKTAHILEGVPEVVEYKYGRTLVAWLVAPVPRDAWPGKPAVAPGPELGPALLNTNTRTGVPPAIVGELYLNFGLLGVMVGLLAIGLVLRSLYATLWVYFPSVGIVLLFAVLSSRLAFDQIGNSVGNAFTKLGMELIPLVLAIWACTRPAERPEQTELS
jgi:hypothetical protein